MEIIVTVRSVARDKTVINDDGDHNKMSPTATLSQLCSDHVLNILTLDLVTSGEV